MIKGFNIVLAVPLALLLSACLGDPLQGEAASSVYVVDVKKVLSTSRAAEAGRAHLAEARKALEKGYADLSRAWEKQPEAERKRVLAEGARTLSRQMDTEQRAVTNMVTALMLEEIRAWRAANKAPAVVARHNVLDAAPETDITATIITGMDKRKPAFAALPVVNVTPPPAARATSPAAPVVREAPSRRANERKH